VQPFILLIILVVALLETIGGVSRPYTTIILATFRVVLTGVFMFCNGNSTLTVEQEYILRHLPADVRTIRQRLKIDPEYISYVCC
ncbi:hypothetical protein BDN72DRAFT_749047, partial [Pluteus cervinus]